MGPESTPIRFHHAVLGVVQKQALRQLGPVMTHWRFYLGGGTALALYLGHRHSMDLDWFTGEQIADSLRLAQDLREEGISLVTGRIARGTLHGSVSSVRVSFLAYRYPLLQPLVSWPESGCLIAALDDLVCMKLAALAQRGSKKDFVDIYALGLRHKPLPEMLRLYRQKYAVADVIHVLYGLAYFHDADKERMPRMFWDTDWRTVKKTIQRWVKEVAE